MTFELDVEESRVEVDGLLEVPDHNGYSVKHVRPSSDRVAGKLFTGREKRISDAIALRKPDRVPARNHPHPNNSKQVNDRAVRGQRPRQMAVSSGVVNRLAPLVSRVPLGPTMYSQPSGLRS